jgi:hypothetical protein
MDNCRFRTKIGQKYGLLATTHLLPDSARPL